MLETEISLRPGLLLPSLLSVAPAPTPCPCPDLSKPGSPRGHPTDAAVSELVVGTTLSRHRHGCLLSWCLIFQSAGIFLETPGHLPCGSESVINQSPGGGMPETPGLPARARAASSSPRSPRVWQKVGQGLGTDSVEKWMPCTRSAMAYVILSFKKLP